MDLLLCYFVLGAVAGSQLCCAVDTVQYTVQCTVQYTVQYTILYTCTVSDIITEKIKNSRARGARNLILSETASAGHANFEFV